MIPLDRELSPDEIHELLSLIRRATRPATAALSRIMSEPCDRDAHGIYSESGFQAQGGDLFSAPGVEPGSPPIYLSHSTADDDAAIVRPLGWRDPSASAEIRDLLFGMASISTGGYALARLGDRDLFLFLDHLATQRLDVSEVVTSLDSAQQAGARCGVDSDRREPSTPLAREVRLSIDEFLLSRPTSWKRADSDSQPGPGWILEGDAPLAAYLDEERGLLVVARGLRSFLGNLPLDVAERLLRKNLGLLDGAIAALRDGAQGAIVILQRLCCQDLDSVELERSVAYLEGLKVPWARNGRSALELLGTLQRSRPPIREEPTLPSPSALDTTSRWPSHLELGARESGEEFCLPVTDLLTHLFVCGGSGSGKTIACKGLIEELALAGIPSIVVDLKGDLSSLACVPEATDAEGIAKYLVRLYGEAALSSQAEISRSAQHAAERYLEAGLDDAALREFRTKVCFRVLTPRSGVGIPISLSPLGKIELGSLGETAGIIGNRTLHEFVDANLRSLVDHLELSGGDTETLVAVLTQLLESAHRRGLPLQGIEGVETLVKLLFQVSEHTDTINFLPTEWAIESTQAQKYARAMNARLGGTFRYWFDGESVSIDDLITRNEGRVPINIVNLSMLPSARDQAYAIAQLSGYIIEWMRRQPGAQRPRLAYFIDEIAQDGGKGAIFPPYPRNPITKPGLTVLLKQGRAFGVTCILATQNAKDIDYKGLGQIDTWITGRLKTTADLERLKLGIEAAQTEATHCFGDQADDILSRVAGLPPGSFVIKTRDSGVTTYRQRWIRSLHERLSPEMLQQWARAEELAVDRQIEAAQDLWNQGQSEPAIQTLESVVSSNTYYSRVAEVRLVLCEWLFRTEQWSRAAEYSAALRETVRSRAGFELVHYYEGRSQLELGNLDQARLALERFVSTAAAASSELGERCRRQLEDLFVAQDDYDGLAESASEQQETKRTSRLLAFCRTMKEALTTWPSLRGNLEGATVFDRSDEGEPDRLQYAQKGARSVQAYAAEIQRRLGDLDLSAPEVQSLTPDENAHVSAITGRIQLDEAQRRAERERLDDSLAEVERLIDEGDYSAASQEIESAKKLVRTTGLPAQDLERVISLYRGATSAGRQSIREWLVNLEPHRFELEIAALFRSLGYDAHATKASGDGGVDVWAERQSRRYVIQCKRYRHPVAPGDIRELATAARNFDADEAIFVTTSRFTEGCREEADRHRIRLIDLDELLALYASRSRKPAARRPQASRLEPRSAPTPGVDLPPQKFVEHILICLDGAPGPLMVGEIAERCSFAIEDCKPVLAKLVAEGVVTKTGQRRGTRYSMTEDD